jgi:hypothetical protein
MAGVTHFERRDKAGQAKKEHPHCPFCNDEFRCTPKTIARAGGPAKYIDAYHIHLMHHLSETLTYERADFAVRAMKQFAPVVWDNC